MNRPFAQRMLSLLLVLCLSLGLAAPAAATTAGTPNTPVAEPQANPQVQPRLNSLGPAVAVVTIMDAFGSESTPSGAFSMRRMSVGNITIAFDSPLSAIPGTITLTKEGGSPVALNAPVSAPLPFISVQYGADQPLESNALYTLRIEGYSNEQNETMTPLELTFTTLAAAPVLLGVAPGPGSADHTRIATSGSLSLAFDQAIAAGYATVTLQAGDNAASAITAIHERTTGDTSIYRYFGLAPDTVYTLHAANFMAAQNSELSALNTAFTLTTLAAQPDVTNIGFYGATLDIPLAQNSMSTVGHLSFTFDRDISDELLGAMSVSLQNPDDVLPAATLAAPQRSADDPRQFIVAYPSGELAQLDSNSTYTIVVSFASTSSLPAFSFSTFMETAEFDALSATLTPNLEHSVMFHLSAQGIGGIAPYAYAWEKRSDGGSSFIPLDDPVQIQTLMLGEAVTHGDVYRCKVTDAAGTIAYTPEHRISLLGTPDTHWYTQAPEASSYTIKTADELAGLSLLVNAGNSFMGKTINLDLNHPLLPMSSAELSLAAYPNWTPIGTAATPFAGTFIGVPVPSMVMPDLLFSPQITDLSFDANDATAIGLFGYVTGGIKQLNMAFPLIQNISDATKAIGSIAGVVDGGSIENCVVLGNAPLPAINASSNTAFGAVAGMVINSGNMKECASTNVSFTIERPGIVFGGVAGQVLSGSSLIDCAVTYLTVTVKDAAHSVTVGGLAGELSGMGSSIINPTTTVNSSITIQTLTQQTSWEQATIAGIIAGQVSNNARIAITSTPLRSNTIAAQTPYCYIGGITGQLLGGATIIGAGNAALSSGSSQFVASASHIYAGGIAGEARGSGTRISSIKTIDAVSATLTGSSDVYLGGIAGSLSGGAVIDSISNHANVTIQASGMAGGIAGEVKGGGTRISLVTNSGEITATQAASEVWLGGIAGSLSGSAAIGQAVNLMKVQTSASGAAGGIVGAASNGAVIEDGTNADTISGSADGVNLGGIAGMVEFADVLIDRCRNSGFASITNSGNADASREASATAGGIVGLAVTVAGANADVTGIRSPVNSGDITLTGTGDLVPLFLHNSAGGIVGRVEGIGLLTIVAAAEYDPANTGTIEATGDYSVAGGVVGGVDLQSEIIIRGTPGLATNQGNIIARGSSSSIGGIAGSIQAKAALTNVSNEGSVSAHHDFTNAGGLAGAFAGKAHALLKDALNSGVVTIAGHLSSAGGIAGWMGSEATIESAQNSGAVLATQSAANASVGGIAGRISTSSMADPAARLSNVQNQGAVTAAGTESFAGGIAGNIQQSDINLAPILIQRAINSAAVTVKGITSSAGGIAGQAIGKTTIEACQNSGVITLEATAASGFAGGIAGKMLTEDSASGTITQCANLGSITSIAGGSLGGLVGYAQNAVITQSFAYAGSNGNTLKTLVQNASSVNRSSIGGLVGHLDGGRLSDSYAWGNLDVSGRTMLGGIAGQSSGAIERCHIVADAIFSHNDTLQTAGIVGVLVQAGSVTNCAAYVAKIETVVSGDPARIVADLANDTLVLGNRAHAGMTLVVQGSPIGFNQNTTRNGENDPSALRDTWLAAEGGWAWPASSLPRFGAAHPFDSAQPAGQPSFLSTVILDDGSQQLSFSTLGTALDYLNSLGTSPRDATVTLLADAIMPSSAVLPATELTIRSSDADPAAPFRLRFEGTVLTASQNLTLADMILEFAPEAQNDNRPSLLIRVGNNATVTLDNLLVPDSYLDAQGQRLYDLTASSLSTQWSFTGLTLTYTRSALPASTVPLALGYAQNLTYTTLKGTAQAGTLSEIGGVELYGDPSVEQIRDVGSLTVLTRNSSLSPGTTIGTIDGVHEWDIRTDYLTVGHVLNTRYIYLTGSELSSHIELRLATADANGSFTYPNVLSTYNQKTLTLLPHKTIIPQEGDVVLRMQNAEDYPNFRLLSLDQLYHPQRDFILERAIPADGALPYYKLRFSAQGPLIVNAIALSATDGNSAPITLSADFVYGDTRTLTVDFGDYAIAQEADVSFILERNADRFTLANGVVSADNKRVSFTLSAAVLSARFAPDSFDTYWPAINFCLPGQSRNSTLLPSGFSFAIKPRPLSAVAIFDSPQLGDASALATLMLSGVLEGDEDAVQAAMQVPIPDPLLAGTPQQIQPSSNGITFSGAKAHLYSLEPSAITGAGGASLTVTLPRRSLELAPNLTLTKTYGQTQYSPAIALATEQLIAGHTNVAITPVSQAIVFASEQAGSGITVTVPLTITGADAGLYRFSGYTAPDLFTITPDPDDEQKATLTFYQGQITKRALVIAPAPNQSGVYNGTLRPDTPISYSAPDLLAGHTLTNALTLSGANVGTRNFVLDEPMIVDGQEQDVTASYDIQLGGQTATYTVTQADVPLQTPVADTAFVHIFLSNHIFLPLNTLGAFAADAPGDPGFSTYGLRMDSDNTALSAFLSSYSIILHDFEDGNGTVPTLRLTTKISLFDPGAPVELRIDVLSENYSPKMLTVPIMPVKNRFATVIMDDVTLPANSVYDGQPHGITGTPRLVATEPVYEPLVATLNLEIGYTGVNTSIYLEQTPVDAGDYYVFPFVPIPLVLTTGESVLMSLRYALHGYTISRRPVSVMAEGQTAIIGQNIAAVPLRAVYQNFIGTDGENAFVSPPELEFGPGASTQAAGTFAIRFKDPTPALNDTIGKNYTIDAGAWLPGTLTVAERHIAPPLPLVTPAPTLPPYARPPQMTPVASGTITLTAQQHGGAIGTISQQALSSLLKDAFALAKPQGPKLLGATIDFTLQPPSPTTSQASAPSSAPALELTFERGALETMVAASIGGLALSGDALSLTFDLDALHAILAATDGDVRFTLTPVTGLSGEARRVIGARTVYSLTISGELEGDAVVVSDFGDGGVRIFMPYTPARGETPAYLRAVYVDDEGNLIPLDASVYDPALGGVVLYTTHFSSYGIGYMAPKTASTDVAEHFAKHSIELAVSRGLIDLDAKGKFAPSSVLTRAQLAKALAVLAGANIPEVTKSRFSDVKNGDAFAGFIHWAVDNKLIASLTATRFAPDTAVSREEMAQALYAFAGLTGFDLIPARAYLAFLDAQSIASPARAAVAALQQAGIVMAKTGETFAPKASVTRAEASLMLSRYLTLSLSPQAAQGFAQNDSGQILYYQDGLLLTGKQTLDGSAYVFLKNGILDTGWVTDAAGNRSYLAASKPVTGFYDVAAKRYYFNARGVMVRSSFVEVSSKWYYLLPDGTLARSTKVNGFAVDQNGVVDRKK